MYKSCLLVSSVCVVENESLSPFGARPCSSLSPIHNARALQINPDVNRSASRTYNQTAEILSKQQKTIKVETLLCK
jgi:hypothetical protein